MIQEAPFRLTFHNYVQIKCNPSSFFPKTQEQPVEFEIHTKNSETIYTSKGSVRSEKNLEDGEYILLSGSVIAKKVRGSGHPSPETKVLIKPISPTSAHIPTLRAEFRVQTEVAPNYPIWLSRISTILNRPPDHFFEKNHLGEKTETAVYYTEDTDGNFSGVTFTYDRKSSSYTIRHMSKSVAGDISVSTAQKISKINLDGVNGRCICFDEKIKVVQKFESAVFKQKSA